MHQIGVGVLGPVFRTYDPAEDRLVAVKAFHIDLTPEQAVGFVESLTELVNIGWSHPAIVAPLAAGIEEGVPYLAQEYVAAESLDVAMRHYAPAAAATALPFITQIGEAIDAAHERGVTQGALHLRDIFVTPEEARTTGFGIVHALEKVGLRGPIRRPYAAPELIAGRPWAGEADRFALAAIAYELLTGKRAAGSGDQVAERLDTIPDVDDRDALRRVFAIALSDAPESRYSSAAGLVVALRTAIGVEAEPPVAGQTAPAVEAAPAIPVAGDGETISDLLAHLEIHPEEGVSPPAPVAPPPPEPPLHAPPADSVETAAVPETEPESWPEPGFDDEIVQRGLSTDAALDALDRSLADIEALDPAVRDRSMSYEAAVPAADAGDGQADPPDEAEIANRTARETPFAGASDPDLREPELPLAAEAAVADEVVDSTGVETYPPIALPGLPADDQPAFDDDAGPHAPEPVAAGAEHETLEQPMLGALDRDVANDVDGSFGIDDDDDDDDDDEPDIEPTSPWSPRAMAPVALAIAVGTLTAYVVWLGIGSRGDETAPVESAPTAETVTVPDADGAAGDEESSGSGPARADESPRDERGQEWSQASVAADGAGAPVGADTSRPTPLGVPPAPVPAEPIPESAPPTPRAAPAAPVPPPVTPRQASSGPAPVEPRGTGWLLVRTNPPGATVRVDGVDRGQTPLSLQDVPFGSHEVALSRAGFEDRARDVDLSADAAVAAVSVDLVSERVTGTTTAAPRASGSLFVDSRPPGARVLIDGRATGTTPVLVPNLAPGDHRVRIERDGYQSWTTTVALSGTERVRVAASLEGEPPR